MAIYMMTGLFGLLLLANLILFKKASSPAVICAGIWFVVFLIGDISDGAIVYNVSLLPRVIAAAGVVLFSAGALLCHRIPMTSAPPQNPQHAKNADRITTVFGLLALLLLPVYIMTAMRIAATGDSGIFLVDLRWALNYQGVSLGPVLYASTLSLFTLMWHFSYGSRNAWKSWAIFLLAMTYAVLSTGRQLIVMTLLGTLVPMVLRKRISAGKAGTIAISGILVGFVSVALVLGKGGNLENSVAENIGPASRAFGFYLLSPLAAFDYWLAHNPNYVWGAYTFRFLAAVVHNFDPTVIPISLVCDFVPVPDGANVYTLFQFYMADFGIVYALLMMFLFGLLTEYAHRKADLGFDFYKLLYIILLYCLLMQFFEDQYIALMPGWIYLFFLYFAAKALVAAPTIVRSAVSSLQKQSSAIPGPVSGK